MRRSLLAVPAVALLLASCSGADGAPAASSAASSAGAPAAEEAPCPDEGEPFEGDTLLYVEYNETDQDVGVHGRFGFDGLRDVCLRDPAGERRLVVDPLGPVDDLGINDFFFESREPPLDEYSIEDLVADFPEGGYTVSGTDFEGTPRVGTARFTHAVPRGPVITEPELATEEAAGDAVVPPTGVTVRWEPVAETIDGEPVTVTGYQVTVLQVEWDDPDSASQPTYDVHVPAGTTELAVADGFLQPGTLYEVEVIVLEESGNQTITAGFFTTAG